MKFESICFHNESLFVCCVVCRYGSGGDGMVGLGVFNWDNRMELGVFTWDSGLGFCKSIHHGSLALV